MHDLETLSKMGFRKRNKLDSLAVDSLSPDAAFWREPPLALRIKELCTANATTVEFWDSSLLGRQDGTLNKLELQEKFADLEKTWKTAPTLTEPHASNGKFVLVTATGDACAADAPLQINRADLASLLDAVGFQNAMPFYSARQFIFQDYLQFEGEADDPTSLTILIRYPRNTRSITLSLRISLINFTATAFVFGRRVEDVEAVRDRCITDAELLRRNPLHILGFIYDHCFLDWVSWFQELWKELAEVETATKMTRPSWRLNTMDPERLQLLSQSQNLQILLHATFTEICHYEAAITSAVKYGQWYFEIMDKVDANRVNLGKTKMTRRQREELEGKFRFTLVRCTAILDRVMEMRLRLTGQINVAMSLITQKDSKINLAVAEMAVRDSGLVKAIAIMTLLFLPLSLITQIWSADLFHLKTSTNVLAYVVSTVILTLVVFVFWGFFAHQSQRRSGAVLTEATRQSSFDDLFYRG